MPTLFIESLADASNELPSPTHRKCILALHSVTYGILSFVVSINVLESYCALLSIICLANRHSLMSYSSE